MKIVKFNPLIFLMIFLLSFSFVACGSDDDDKNEEEPKDTEAPVISITAPESGDSFNRGIEEITVNGEITDNVELESCVISLSTELKSTSIDNGDNDENDIVTSIDDDEIFEPADVDVSVSGESHTFSDLKVFGTIPDNATTGEYIILVEAKDVAGNTASEEINITITSAE